MKKIINQPETLVMEMCNGIAMAHPELEFVKKYKVIKKRNINPEKVSLISGGGSGHEPAHGGFVGEGLLDGAVCGDVFASPSQIQVYQGIKETASKCGTLLIIKNYSGDIMNFRNGLHLAQEDGLQVDYVKVDDDIAVEDSLYTVGHRGVAGTIFVHKIAGAAAEMGKNLQEVKAIAQKTIDHVKTIGFALTSCTVPAKGSPTFELGADEIEYGVGIHGEPGIKKEKVLTADELAHKTVAALLKSLTLEDSQDNKSKKTEVALLINGFGGTPLQELYLLNNSVTRELTLQNLVVSRTFVGNYMTSIDMAGASVSILKLDSELKEYLSYPCNGPAFKINHPVDNVTYCDIVKEEAKAFTFNTTTSEDYAEIQDNKCKLNNVIYMVDKMSESIIANEVAFCDLDSHAGDGDFGMSVAKGFKQLKREWDEILEKATTIGEFLDACSLVIMEYCGGASGPIWGSGFRAAGKYAGNKTELSQKEFAEMLQAVVKGIQLTGERSFGRGAVVGDKTLIDALVPCADSWLESADANLSFKMALEKGAVEAFKGANSTSLIAARMGRAGTVGDRSIGYPDAGAYGLAVIFTDIAKAMK